MPKSHLADAPYPLLLGGGLRQQDGVALAEAAQRLGLRFQRSRVVAAELDDQQRRGIALGREPVHEGKLGGVGWHGARQADDGLRDQFDGAGLVLQDGGSGVARVHQAGKGKHAQYGEARQGHQAQGRLADDAQRALRAGQQGRQVQRVRGERRVWQTGIPLGRRGGDQGSR